MGRASAVGPSSSWACESPSTAHCGKDQGGVGTGTTGQPRLARAKTQGRLYFEPTRHSNRTTQVDIHIRFWTAPDNDNHQGQSKLQTRTNNPQRRSYLAYFRYILRNHLTWGRRLLCVVWMFSFSGSQAPLSLSPLSPAPTLQHPLPPFPT